MNPAEPQIPFIPWHKPALWAEANRSVARAVALHGERLAPAMAAARQLKQQLVSLFPLMDRLCAATCPQCRDICCLHACIWADFKDLLFYHLAKIPLPEAQPLSQRGQRCRYGSPAGCQLDRLQRPFICTWYLCPAQTGQLRLEPGRMQQIQETLQAAKRLRGQMEDDFVRAVWRGWGSLNR